MKCKILSPAPYQVTDVLNDNMDVQIVTAGGVVYWGTVFTLQNIATLMRKIDSSPYYFWATDMVIVRDLELATLRKAVDEIVAGGYLEDVFTMIGDVQKVYGANASFDMLVSIC